MARLHKRYGRKKRTKPEGSYRSNPPLFTDMLEFIGPGFAAFAATRFLTRIAATQLAKRKPSWGKHAGAVTSIASFLAAWWGAHRVKYLEKYHTPIVVGSALATLQSIIQLYIPRLGWMLETPDPTQEASAAAPALPAASAPALPGVEFLDEDPNEYTYNDAYDAGRQTPPTAASSPNAPEGDIIADLDLDDMDDINLGSLGF